MVFVVTVRFTMCHHSLLCMLDALGAARDLACGMPDVSADSWVSCWNVGVMDRRKMV